MTVQYWLFKRNNPFGKAYQKGFEKGLIGYTVVQEEDSPTLPSKSAQRPVAFSYRAQIMWNPEQMAAFTESSGQTYALRPCRYNGISGRRVGERWGEEPYWY